MLEGYDAGKVKDIVKAEIKKYWHRLSQEIEQTYIKPHKNYNDGISPTWDEFIAWQEKELEFALGKYVEDIAERLKRKRWRERKASMMNFLKYIVAGVVGAVLTKFGEDIYNWLFS